MAKATSSRIRPGIDLLEINIRLSKIGPPTVELRGKLATGNRMVDQASQIVIKTMTLDQQGQTFVSHMKDLYSKP